MNVFFLDHCPKQSARDLGDKHIGKMLLESCQMMSTAARLHGFDGGYASAYQNHPMTKWVGESYLHYEWVLSHAIELAKEHERRFGTTHKSSMLLPTLAVACHTVMPDEGWSNPPRCMPNEFKIGKSWVESYRNYYRLAKAHLHKWTNAEVPQWL